MPIRLARASDLPAISACCAAGFANDELFSNLIHPRRQQYPADYVAFWHRRNRENWWDWAHTYIVATEQDENGNEIIVGVAEWEKQGPNATGLWRWDPRRLMKPLQILRNAVSSYFFPNRAAHSPEALTIFHRAFPFFSHIWQSMSPTGTRRDNGYYLDLLAIDPRFHRRGLGRLLCNWGIDKARREGVCASVVASGDAESKGFYQSVGFVTPAGRATEGEGNPLSGYPLGANAIIKGGLILFMDAPSSGEAKEEVVETSGVMVEMEEERYGHVGVDIVTNRKSEWREGKSVTVTVTEFGETSEFTEVMEVKGIRNENSAVTEVR
ncbi:hypothetical protein M501DRAFT_985169 [Patellaria atrata CBS 101060]|uniref:N-acetyltransferase domain-containing protein n=1 Tax=Patellaria atrata CBS 101060 TaxID=1346257 RepID=A0A9P4VWS2_9PEZI|nr:hypothetical protein M501DRAFT_985169 [Patellaria atrata CBS 101060]